jgi:hypothetical protein
VVEQRAYDLAHTIALMVLETLTPLLPALSRELPAALAELPPEQASPGPASAPAEVSTSPAALPAPESPPLRFVPFVGLGTQLAHPWQAGRPALSAGSLFDRGDLAAGVALDLGARRSARGADYRLTTDIVTLTLTAGLQRHVDLFDLKAELGPALRGVRLSAEGRALQEAPHNFLNLGAALSLGAYARLEPVVIGLRLRAIAYSAHQRFIVDGASALDVGGMLMDVGVVCGWTL